MNFDESYLILFSMLWSSPIVLSEIIYYLLELLTILWKYKWILFPETIYYFLKLFTIFWTCLLPEIQTFLILNSTKLLTSVSFTLRQMTVCKLIWGINIEVIILPSPNVFLFFIKLYSVIKYCLRKGSYRLHLYYWRLH